MNQVKNLDHKRVGDLSKDERIFEIRQKDCMTIIMANSDGRLKITHERVAPTT